VREGIVIGWEEWRASRAAKRANLRRLGLDAPSRRTTDYGNAGRRLRNAFGGARVPSGVKDRGQWTEDRGENNGLWRSDASVGRPLSLVLTPKT